MKELALVTPFEMLDMIHDLQTPNECEEETEEDLENEMSCNSGVDIEEETTNVVFHELLNQASCELYLDCSEFSSLNFFVMVMHLKVLNSWSNKSFDMMLEIIKCVFPMCGTNISSSFYEAKRKLRELDLGYENIHDCKYDCVLL